MWIRKDLQEGEQQPYRAEAAMDHQRQVTNFQEKLLLPMHMVGGQPNTYAARLSRCERVGTGHIMPSKATAKPHASQAGAFSPAPFGHHFLV